MKSIVVALVLCLFAVNGGDALFGGIVSGISSGIGTITNGISSGVNAVSNGISGGINTISNGVNAAITGGQFIWDNAFQPALETLVNNGIVLIDDYFGDILNAIGKRQITTAVDERAQIKEIFKSVVRKLISNLHQLFDNLLKNSAQAVLTSVSDIVNGKVTLVQVLTPLVANLQQAVQQLVASASALFGLPMRNLSLAGLTSQINAIFNQIGQHFIDKVETILQGMFTSLTTQNIGVVPEY